EVLAALEGAADDMARQTETMLFRKLDETTAQVGNVLDAGGRPFEPSMLLEMLERTWIDFNDEGKPKMPTIVLHPNVFESVKERLLALDSDGDFQAKQAEILAKKKEQWRDRESNRKLVG